MKSSRSIIALALALMAQPDRAWLHAQELPPAGAASDATPKPLPDPAPPAAISTPPDAAEAAKPAEPPIPGSYPLSRYEESWKKNPFMLKTTPVAVVKISFAEEWALASISKRDGKAVVRILNKKSGERRTVKETPGKDDEFRLVKADISRDYKKSTADIAKGDEIGTVRHDETLAAARAPAQGAPRGGQPGAPGTQPFIPGQVQRPGGANQPIMRPGGYPGSPVTTQQQPGIQRPGMTAPPGMAAVAPPTVPVTVPLPGGTPQITPQISNTGGANRPGSTTDNPNQGTPAPVSRRRMLIPGPIPTQ